MLESLIGPTPCPCCAYSHAGSVLAFSPTRAFSSMFGRLSAPTKMAEAALSQSLRTQGVTIVDPRDGSIAAGMTILTNMGRITDIFPTGSKPVDPHINAVDAQGKFVVPGYNDMHSHVLELSDPSGEAPRWNIAHSDRGTTIA
jgi:imidazolonepropionase-like amidohydrolase